MSEERKKNSKDEGYLSGGIVLPRSIRFNDKDVKNNERELLKMAKKLGVELGSKNNLRRFNEIQPGGVLPSPKRPPTEEEKTFQKNMRELQKKIDEIVKSHKSPSVPSDGVIIEENKSRQDRLDRQRREFKKINDALEKLKKSR